MAKGNREVEVFGLSFMDLISCGLGGMLVLMFVFSTLVSTKGVSRPSEAKKGNMSIAALERQQIFNTNFVIKMTLPKSAVVAIPSEYQEIITVGETTDDPAMTMKEHLYMIHGMDRVIKEMTFDITNLSNNGEVELMGGEVIVLEPNDQTVTVMKNKTSYRLIKS